MRHLFDENTMKTDRFLNIIFRSHYSSLQKSF